STEGVGGAWAAIADDEDFKRRVRGFTPRARGNARDVTEGVDSGPAVDAHDCAHGLKCAVPGVRQCLYDADVRGTWVVTRTAPARHSPRPALGARCRLPWRTAGGVGPGSCRARACREGRARRPCVHPWAPLPA